jgi:membrane protein DedA with SNARE-associated domain
MIDQLMNWSLHPVWTCAAIMLIMALESAPLIGFFLPGGTTLVAIGALSGAGVTHFFDALLCATMGSLIGDSLGFWLGHAGRKALHDRWQTDPQRMQRAQQLIQRHGLRGIFLGRLLWVVHVAVPIAAGIANIRARNFYLLDAAAAALWCAIHLALGHWATRAVLTSKGLVDIGMALALFVAVLALGWWLRRRA